MKLDMRKRLDEVSMNLVIQLVKNDVEVDDTPLEDVLKDTYGMSFRRGVEAKINGVRNTVIEDMKEGKVDPKESDHPFRFIANSIVIHALELAIANSSHYEDLREVREEGIHNHLNQQLTLIHKEREEEKEE